MAQKTKDEMNTQKQVPIKKIYVKIDGIHCSHCEAKITAELLKNKNIKEVKIKNNIADISYKENLEHMEIINSIKSTGYFTKEDYISDNLKKLIQI